MMRLLALVLALVLIAAPAQAGPAFGAGIAAFFQSIGSAFAAGGFFTTAVGRIVLGLALSALSRALTPKPKEPGIKTEVTQTGGTNPQSFLLGTYATAGSHVCPPMSHGGELKRLTYVIDLGDIPMGSLLKVFVDGEEVPFDGATHADYGTTATGRLAGKAWLTYHDGTQTVADPYLLGTYGSYPERPWSADMVLTGVPYAILTLKYDRKLYTGFPRVKFEAEGLPLYDPRADTSVGGSGTQRWADTSTWTFTTNPVVMIYNILRGITLPTGDVWGVGADAADLPLSNWFAAMNAADEQVALDVGGTQTRYRAGFEVTVDEEPLAVIDELIKSCGGDVVEFGGYWHAQVGAPDSATLFITDDDILVSSPREFEPFPGLDQTYNAITATYPDRDGNWERTDAEPLYNATWETEDGSRRLPVNLQLPAVPYARQVRRLMREMAQDNRRFRSHVIVLPPDALHVLPLQTISWTSDHNNYTAKLFEVRRKAIDPQTLASALLIRERDPSDYDDDAADDAVIPSPPTGTIISPQIDGIDGWSVTAVVGQDASAANRRVGIKLAWNTDTSAAAISWQVRVQATGEDVSRGTIADLDEGQMFIWDGLLPATAYEVRGRAVSNQETLWETWVTVTTADVRFDEADIAADIIADLSTALSTATTVESDLTALTVGLVGTIAEADSAVQTTLQSSVDAVDARVDDVMALTADAGSAFATLLTDLQVDAGGNSASITELYATKADVDGFSASFAGLTATTSGGYVSGFKATSWSDPDGTGGAVLQLLGDVVVQGSLSVGAINASLDGNLLYNTDFSNGTTHWSSAAVGTIGANAAMILRSPANTFSDGYGVLQIAIYSGLTGATTDGYADWVSSPTDADGTAMLGIPVAGGARYEFSAQIAQIGSECDMIITWRDENGTNIASPDTYSHPKVNFFQSGSGTNPASWARVGGFATAPAGAAYAIVRFRMNAKTTDIGSSAYIFIRNPYFGAASSVDQDAFSPFRHGSAGTLDGGYLIANTVVASKIVIDNVTLDTNASDELIIKTAGVDTTQVALNAITNGAALDETTSAFILNAIETVNLSCTAGNEVLFWARGFSEKVQSVADNIYWRLRWNGTLLNEETGFYANTTNGAISTFDFWGRVSAVGGSNTLSLEFDSDNGRWDATIGSMMVLEIKR